MIRRTGLGLVMVALLTLAACGGSTRSAKRIEVHMSDDNKFSPGDIVAVVGDTVEFINDGTVPHTATDMPGPDVVADHNVLPSGAEPWAHASECGRRATTPSAAFLSARAPARSRCARQTRRRVASRRYGWSSC